MKKTILYLIPMKKLIIMLCIALLTSCEKDKKLTIITDNISVDTIVGNASLSINRAGGKTGFTITQKTFYEYKTGDNLIVVSPLGSEIKQVLIKTTSGREFDALDKPNRTYIEDSSTVRIINLF